MKRPLEIAITGIGTLLPGAQNKEQFYQTIENGISHLSHIASERWLNIKSELLASHAAPDRAISDYGYFIESYDIDKIEIGSKYRAYLRELDPVAHIAMLAGQEAYRDSKSKIRGKRAGVILGNIALPTEKVSKLSLEIAMSIIKGQKPELTCNLNSYVNSLPAMLLADSLGFEGCAITMDAACASSLYAIKLACSKLASGEVDFMLSGGVARPDPLYTAMGFTQLSALSPNGICAPFDARANGLVLGEGAAIVGLKRVEDAIQDGDKIYGVIKAVGISNDLEGSLFSPASEGQLRAMQSAYKTAGWSPEEIDLFECHATGTPVGDRVEIESLKKLFGNRESGAVLASSKSNVGHLLTGAGAVGVVKTALCMQHGILPPTANFESTLHDLGSFRVLKQKEVWRSSGRKKAAVSAFGFGGINAHLLIEEFASDMVPTAREIDSPKVAVIGVGFKLGDKNYTASELFSGKIETNSGVGRFSQTQLKESLGKNLKDGVYSTQFNYNPKDFRIPPAELKEMLPQQILLLSAASRAIKDAKLKKEELIDTGALIGIEFDFATTEYYIRWSLEKELPKLGYSREKIEELKNNWIPALNANRTMGSLGSITASRAARELRLGGATFSISAYGDSSFAAIDLALELLRTGDLNVALAGGVDITSDPRYQLTRSQIADSELLGDGAATLVLKRYEDALRDGNKIYATLEKNGGSENRFDEYTYPKMEPFSGSFAKTIYTGSAATAFAAIKAATMLHDKIVYSENGHAATHWLRNRQDGKRSVKLHARDPFEKESVLTLKDTEFENPIPRVGIEEGLLLLSGKTEAQLKDSSRKLASALKNEKNAAKAIALGKELSEIGDAHVAIRFKTVAAAVRALIKFADSKESVLNGEDGIYYSSTPSYSTGGTAFIFPGSGNHYLGMGREAALAFPEILMEQDRENLYLKEQYRPNELWLSNHSLNAHPELLLQCQVSNCTLLCDIVRSWGVVPDASIGYSLGEMAGIVSLKVWHSRDEMMEKLKNSELFTRDLAGKLEAVKKVWNLPEDAPTPDWSVGVINGSASEIREAIKKYPHLYLAIINTDTDCVVSGETSQLKQLAEEFHTVPLPIEGVITAHCEVLQPVASEYRDFHLYPSTPPKDIKFYSTALGGVYTPTDEAIADSILKQASDTIDFPRIIRRAWEDGIRTFIEIGPDNSCTRMVNQILKDKPHLAICTTKAGHSELDSLEAAAATLYANGFPIDGSCFALHEKEEEPIGALKISFTKPLFNLEAEKTEQKIAKIAPTKKIEPIANIETDGYLKQFLEARRAVAEAHAKYLDFSARAIQMAMGASPEFEPQTPPTAKIELPVQQKSEPFMDRAACMEFAIGSIGAVLGEEFAEIDTHPTRVRLPDEPMMLVDRILSVDAKPKSMSGGRLVTEHDVLQGAWYLDNGRIPTCIAVEAGQADLFLSAYLGADFQTKGLAVYRLLDATVHFHDHLPTVGDTIRYNITIKNFFTQGSSWLFKFNFEATVNGAPLLSMENGCAGFFTQKELDEGRGIIYSALDLKEQQGKMTEGFQYPIAPKEGSISSEQLQALREGDLVAAFGESFRDIKIKHPLTLPKNEKMKLIDRITSIEPNGGKYHLGKICSEIAIHPDDWFLTCHFSDDNVMPGTLMYECSMHTLRVFLLSIGFIDEMEDTCWEPIPAVRSSLKCRGQITEKTSISSYEIYIKEIGYRPEPYAIADAIMLADGKPIVAMNNMSLRLSGSSRERLEKIFAKEKIKAAKPIFDRASIIEFAKGMPSKALGQRFKVFDHGRKMARLPSPPFSFIDRITKLDVPEEMVPAGEVASQWDLKGDEWFFTESDSYEMPFVILLEAALQPCGWLAAYSGSALTSNEVLKFRNLGGTGNLVRVPNRESGMIESRVRMTGVSPTPTMIIQHYEFNVYDIFGLVYEGTTYFGFFTDDAFKNQVGLRGESIPEPNGQNILKAAIPFDLKCGKLKMLDQITCYVPNGGPFNKGFIQGEMNVSPDAWFFKAHFYQDPVIPGSLGLESMLQLANFIQIHEKRNDNTALQRYNNILPSKHSWIYRGQVIPENRINEITVWVKERTEDDIVTCDGILSVDGKNIYKMSDFRLQI